MDAAAAPAAPSPSGYEITADTARLDVMRSPEDGGKASKLVLRLKVTETHEWLGIGGRRAWLWSPRLLFREVRMLLPLSSGPDYLQRAGDIRRHLVSAAAHEIRTDEALRGLPASDWDAAVPPGVEALVAERAAALPKGCRTGTCEVSFCVHVDFVYDEAATLLRACAVVEAGDDVTGMVGSSTGEASCAICWEDMEATAWLQGCAHGFHGGCIGTWFKKASTCPVCRHDKLPYLPPAYTAARDRILSDLEKMEDSGDESTDEDTDSGDESTDEDADSGDESTDEDADSGDESNDEDADSGDESNDEDRPVSNFRRPWREHRIGAL